MSTARQRSLKNIPSVEALLQDAQLQRNAEALPRKVFVDAVRDAVQQTRDRLLAEQLDDTDAKTLRDHILASVARRIRTECQPHYRRAINATGVILHTALGRAVIPARAMHQIQQEMSGYSLVQADVQSGQRSGREARIEQLLQQLTRTEAATVVNNNAAATCIVLNTVASGREVVVSRGQLVEIGGAFRLPDVMEACGAKLVEVGTTNKTHARDYEQAITENTAAIMRVHPSNYKIRGFTSEVELKEMARIAHAHRLVLIDDIGAGPLFDFSQFGFESEFTLPESVEDGADLITCSADKLIGSCQGGIILGRAELIQAVRKNPLTRIVRVGKLTLAALEATLTLFLDPSLAKREVPTLRMLGRDLSDLTAQAERIASSVAEKVPDAQIEPVAGFSQMGSGSLPAQNLPTRLVAIQSERLKPDGIAARLRAGAPPVFARIHKHRVLVDPRTLQDGEEAIVVAALIDVLQLGDGSPSDCDSAP